MNPPSFLFVAIQSVAGQAADLTFLAYLDIWIISGLVLLAVVVVVGKLVWGKLRRRDDEEFDWYYDDDYVLDSDDDFTDQAEPGRGE